MKNYPVSLHLGKFLAVLSACALGLGFHLQAAPVTWTATTNGNWSDGANWSPGAPATSGDNLIYNIGATNVISTVDSTWATAGSVTGFTFDGTGIGAYTIAGGAGVTSLTIGSGGIARTGATGGEVTFANSLNLILNDNQTWSYTSTSWNTGRLTMNANLSGNATIELSGPSGGRVAFGSGSSAGFTGNFVMNSGAIILTGNTQLARLGPNALTLGNTNGTNVNIQALTGADQALTFATPITFTDTGSSARALVFESTTTGNSSVAITGTWAGNIDDGLRLSSNNPGLLIRLQQNSSTLTSTKGSGNQQNSAIFLQTGIYSVESANALGANNGLTVSIGQHQASGTNLNLLSQGLYTNNGINVAAPLYINYNYQGGFDAARGSIVTVGLRGTGDATFSGSTFTMQTDLTTSIFGGTATSRLPEVRLSAGTGGAVTFSGQVRDDTTASDRSFAPVTVLGGGTVTLSGANNTYGGGTSIIAGTTLLANGGTGASGSTTGSGNLRVGYAAAAFDGTLTTGQSFITGVTSTAGLVVGQTVTGTGIAAGTTITYIDAGRSRIEISTYATATGSQSLATNAETGILGGIGRIKPGVIGGVQQQITAASGSSLAPGNNSIGALTLDGGGTTAPLLTLASGAKFTFELDGSGGTPDQLHFWNYVGGDFVLNSNNIELTLSGTQTLGNHTVSLFRFFSNSGVAATNSGITSGLVAVSLDANISGATLNYNAGGSTIDLNYTIVPEPSTWALLGLGLAATLSLRKRRR